MNPWRPIYTAPKRDIVDLWDSVNQERLVDCWMESDKWYRIGTDDYGKVGKIRVIKPSHWMKRPDDPKF